MKPTDKGLKAEIMRAVHALVYGDYGELAGLVGRPDACLLADALETRLDDPILERVERLARELVKEGKLKRTRLDWIDGWGYAPVQSLN